VTIRKPPGPAHAQATPGRRLAAHAAGELSDKSPFAAFMMLAQNAIAAETEQVGLAGVEW
jgi:hypothetical protein